MQDNHFIQSAVDPIEIKQIIEVSEVTDDDLMRIKCFSIHEGLNGNDFLVSRQVLKEGYPSFIDKAVVIVPTYDNQPQGHGFDFKKKKFNSAIRKFIGHVKDAYPCIVSEDNQITLITPEMDESEYPDGQYRIICELVVHKRYYKEIADVLQELHDKGNLKFSMESLADYVLHEDGVKEATKIFFTGLAIVQNPAFENSYSLEVAEESSMEDFKLMYEEASRTIETLRTEKQKIEDDYIVIQREKQELETEVVTYKDELASCKEQIAELTTQLAEKNSEIEALQPYKEKVENAEKLAVGQARMDKLSKLGEVAQTVEELSELSKDEYANLLIEMAENYKPSEVKGSTVTTPFYEKNNVSDKHKMIQLLADLCE